MFPLPWNKAYRKKDGSLTTIHEAIAGGGTPYTLPTASSETKGGVKIGSGLTMTGEVLSADAQLPAYTIAESGKVLGVDSEGHLAWITVSAGGYSMPRAISTVPSIRNRVSSKAEEVTT